MQTCVIHLVSNTFRYTVAGRLARDRPVDLRPVYTAPTEQAAENASFAASPKVAEIYPAMISCGGDAWRSSCRSSRSLELRKVIYSTNAIESSSTPASAAAARHRGHFPNEQAAMKVLYLTARQRGTSSRGFDRNPGGRGEQLEVGPQRPAADLRRQAHGQLSRCPLTQRIRQTLSTSTKLRRRVAESGEYGSASAAQIRAAGFGVTKTGEGSSHYTVTFPKIMDEGLAEDFRRTFYGGAK